jgi:hypothetical protein
MTRESLRHAYQGAKLSVIPESKVENGCCGMMPKMICGDSPVDDRLPQLQQFPHGCLAKKQGSRTPIPRLEASDGARQAGICNYVAGEWSLHLAGGICPRRLGHEVSCGHSLRPEQRGKPSGFLLNTNIRPSVVSYQTQDGRRSTNQCKPSETRRAVTQKVLANMCCCDTVNLPIWPRLCSRGKFSPFVWHVPVEGFISTVKEVQYEHANIIKGGFLSMPGFLKVFGYYDPKLEKWNIDPTVQQLISSLMTIGTFLSSLLVGPFSARFGRRHGLWAAALLNFIATGIQLGTTSKAALYVARLILGKLKDRGVDCLD